MSELSRFEYPYDNVMYDPELRLRVSMEPGSSITEPRSSLSAPINVSIGIHHDPAIEPGHYSMIRESEPWHDLVTGIDFSLPVPLHSKRSKPLINVLCYAHDCGDTVRFKVHGDGFAFRSYYMRGSIESLRIACVSNDVSSMYIGVFKAYPGLRYLRQRELSPGRFGLGRTIEMCVSTGALTEGLGRSTDDYPLVEEGWHCLSVWPR